MMGAVNRPTLSVVLSERLDQETLKSGPWRERPSAHVGPVAADVAPSQRGYRGVYTGVYKGVYRVPASRDPSKRAFSWEN